MVEVEVVKNSTNIENLSKQQNRIELKIDSMETKFENKITKLQYIITGEFFTLIASIVTLLIKTS